MTNFYEDYEPEKKKSPSRWLIGCGAAFVITLCIVGFVFIGGFAGLMAVFGGEPEGLRVEVTTPESQISVGENFAVSVQLFNDGTQDIDVKEIQLPNDLITKALLVNMSPSGVQGLDYGQKTAFNFDLVIVPNGQETVQFNFQALEGGDISGDVSVMVGTKTSIIPIRVVIASDPANENTSSQDPVLDDVIPYQSVVQILAVIDMDGVATIGWGGSGTIVSDDGLILTNAHVVLSDHYYEVVDLIVSITVEQDLPPVQMFYADVMQVDANLDLAVIKVRSNLDGGPANFSSLGIAPVPLGSSDTLQLGDPIIIIGYPTIGGQTITLTRGEVSGFTAEEPYGNRAFIKTSATISGGNSGGLAANPQGEIIGVPTQLGSGDVNVDYVDCRRLADTNRDGVIDELDNCVPTGGFINALRPLTLALPMIDAAKAGQVALNIETQPEEFEEYDPASDELLNDDFSDNRNSWNTIETSASSSQITGGQMVMQVDDEKLISWVTLPEIYDSLIMVTEAQILNSSDDGVFGFVCGYVDIENFIVMYISEDGYYRFLKYENDVLITLVEWTYSDIVAEAESSMILAAYCGPDRLALAMDDNLLAESVDPNYTAGEVGLIAGTWEYPNFRVGFNDFLILRP